MAHSDPKHSEPRLQLRPILGPGDDDAFPPGSPEYYVENYGVTLEEAEAFVRDVFLAEPPTVLGALYRHVA